MFHACRRRAVLRDHRNFLMDTLETMLMTGVPRTQATQRDNLQLRHALLIAIATHEESTFQQGTHQSHDVGCQHLQHQVFKDSQQSTIVPV